MAGPQHRFFDFKDIEVNEFGRALLHAFNRRQRRPAHPHVRGLRDAHRLGLDYYPVDFEGAPASLMTEIAVYGLPVRMPHWSFGVRYIHQLVRQSMGHSKIFEVMFPGVGCRK